MDERFLLASATRESPRSAGFAQDRLGRPPMDVAQRATPPLLDRFRAMLRDWEEEFRALGGGDEIPPPDGREIVRMYRELLTELTFNSKPIITELTIIAGEQREYARGIVEAVCSRIDEVVQDQKLPALYLLDSIVKNIGDEYVRYFASRLPKTFCRAYHEVHSSLHAAMCHLFGTWSQVFPPSVLGKIEEELKFCAPENQGPSDFASVQASEPPHPSHRIHVNPKYLEAHHQFERPATVIRQSREVSSGIQVSGQRSNATYNDYDLDDFGFQSPSLRTIKEDSPHTRALRGSSIMGQEGPFLSLQGKSTKHLSSTRIGLKRSTSPQGQRFQRSSPGRVIEAAPRSQCGLEFQPQKASEGDGWLERSWVTDDSVQQPTFLTTYNGYGRQRQKELIDAYGNYRGKDTLNESFPKIQRIDVNGIKGEAGKMDWQNSEEEEYVWEDMSPTLADPNKRNHMLPEPSSMSSGLRANSSRPHISPNSDFTNRNLHVQPLKDSSASTDEGIAIRDYSLGPMNKMYLNDTGSTIEQLRRHEGLQHVQKYGGLPHVFHHSQDNLNPKYQARPFQLPYLVSGSAVTPSVKLHGPYGNSHNAEVPLLKLSSVSSDSLNMDMSVSASQKARLPPLAPMIWPQAHNFQHLQLLPTPINLQVDNNKPVGNQQPLSVPLSLQQFDANGGKLFRQAFQETHGGFIPSAIVQTPANFSLPLSGVQPQSSVLDSILRNPISGMAVSAAHYTPNITILGNAAIPPLPPGPPPSSLHPTPTPLNSSATSRSSVTEYTGLISSLMAQGLISLTRPDQSKEIAHLEFNAELLKVRNESVINAMYMELPRQCTTCGLRFTSQEAHSNHMDWHLTKNRVSRNRKQKPSRKWFVSAKEWLCGAETLGTDAVPGFLPTDAVQDKKENREMAVPADENQTVCALCGEPFEDFYSDEAEEWMYRGTIYLNAPSGNIKGLDRSQLGPIVHVKCKSESADGYGQA